MGMKITSLSWDTAPEWANWLAQDEDGSWTWFEHKPHIDGKYWQMGKFGRKQVAYNDSWKYNFEMRPEVKP